MKKGRREGTTEKAQRDKPFFAADKLLEENNIRNMVNVYTQIGSIICFNFKIINLVFLIEPVLSLFITNILCFA